MSDPIPFVDLTAQYRAIKAEIAQAIDAVLESHAYIQGPFVEAFEKDFTAACSAKFGLGCSNGTSAISVLLEAMGIGAGDEVVTVAHTFFATAEAIFHVGAKPVFIDVDPTSYTLDPTKLEAAITPRTRAVIAVHLYGTPCDMDPILKIAGHHKLVVIEDAAQAHLAVYKDRLVGAIGDGASFSFYPGKNLGAYGDAGFMTTSSEAVAKRARQLRDHGRMSKYEHSIVGYNQRMDGIQGAILSVKLKYLQGWTDARRRHAAAYDARLASKGFKTIQTAPGVTSSYHLYPVEVSNRDVVMKALAAEKISCGIHYPVPLHLQPALIGKVPGKGSLPVTERAAERVVSLPIYPELTESQIERISSVFLAHAIA